MTTQFIPSSNPRWDKEALSLWVCLRCSLLAYRAEAAVINTWMGSEKSYVEVKDKLSGLLSGPAGQFYDTIPRLSRP